ncbi:hypothetical protein [Mycolicibacterium llatzerense]|uniref:hypothetical protein n=1 Tax=Mycolicibacterium llatzerense TaxID=280871 RepID=UPI0008DCC2E1|nr:hypothetical protein [Mycolicibacterium llatzerense]
MIVNDLPFVLAVGDEDVTYTLTINPKLREFFIESGLATPNHDVAELQEHVDTFGHRAWFEKSDGAVRTLVLATPEYANGIEDQQELATKLGQMLSWAMPTRKQRDELLAAFQSPAVS